MPSVRTEKGCIEALLLVAVHAVLVWWQFWGEEVGGLDSPSRGGGLPAGLANGFVSWRWEEKREAHGSEEEQTR